MDELVVKEARKVAAAMGTSVNQLVRDYLADLVGKGDADQDIAELEALSLAAGRRPRGWSFDRDELHDRS